MKKMKEIRKTIKIHPIDLLEYVLGEEAEAHQELLGKYRRECEIDHISVDIVLKDHEYEMHNF